MIAPSKVALAGQRHLLLCTPHTSVQQWVRVVRGPDLGVLQVACTAAAGEVVPHAHDLDVLLGLLGAAGDQGEPVRLTAAQLVSRSRQPPGTRGIAAVQASLRRLVGSTFEVLDVGYGHVPQPWVMTQSRLLMPLITGGTARAGAPVGRWEASTQIHAQFSAAFLQVVGAGLFGGLDRAVLSRLRSPLTRHVYVALAQARVLPDGTLAAAYRAPLLGWAELLGLRVDGAQVLRILAPVHADLQRTGALSGVTWRRTGAAPLIEYRFPPPAAPGSVSAHWGSPGRLGIRPLHAHDPGPGGPAHTLEVRLQHPVFMPAPSRPHGRQRTAEDASALLDWRLTRSAAARHVRAQAVQAYLDGRLSEADLIDIGRSASAAQARRWLTRRLRRIS